MEFKIGDKVTRYSYQHDILFRIIEISDQLYLLEGIHVRLQADSMSEDLKLYEQPIRSDDQDYENQIKTILPSRSDDYFYLPGRILHIDGDIEYLRRCMKLYRRANLYVYGVYEKEELLSRSIRFHLETLKPNIVIITGHDAYIKKNTQKHNERYKNSVHFIKAVKEARKYEKDHEQLIIIAGACQSNYEEIIRAGANFASSPRRINIHALDPAIVAIMIAFSSRSQDIDLNKILERTKYKADGMGGIITKGMMYMGFPK